MSDIKFLNVDLDIKSRHPLTSILEAMGEDVVVLHQFEANGGLY